MEKESIPFIFQKNTQKKIKERVNARNPRTGEKVHSKEKISIIFKMVDNYKLI